MDLLLDGAPIAEAPALVEGQWAELAALPPEGATLSLELAGAALEPFLRPGDPAWRWRWLAPAAAGAYELRLRAAWPDGRAEELRAALHVAPRKLDAERYAALLEDLQRLGRALVFALAGGAQGVAPPPAPDPSPPAPGEELHTLFGAELERLAAAVERLARRPPDRLRPAIAQVEPGRLRDFGAPAPPRPGAQAPPAPTEGQAADDPARLVAGLASIPERSSAPTYDSYEARLLRRLLDSLWRRLELLVARERLTPDLEARAAAARERLRALRALPFLAGVPPLAAFAGPTARMQRDPDYRAVYRAWRLLRRRPLIAWDAATLSIPVGDLPRLYERWCAAAVAMALLELPGHALVAQSIVAGDPDELLLALPEGEQLVELEGAGGARLRLRYHPRYRPLGPLPAPPQLGSLDRHTRVPDLALELARPGEPPALLVLDAKYRLDATGGVPEDALADAYSYLGAIGTAEGRRAARAVALLYPGRGPAETYASGVAALPLLPGADGALRAWLAELLLRG